MPETGIPVASMTRLYSVELARVLGMLAVIALHVAQQADPGGFGQRLDLATVFDQLERFAVPMFFTLSGYFWAARCRSTDAYWPQARALARRLLLLFLCWCLVYGLGAVLAAAVRQHSLAQGLMAVAARHSGPLTLLLQGTKVHLWFLPALACAALLSGACLAARRWRLLLLLAALLFLVGLAGKAYAPLLGWAPRFNFRNGPFFSLAPFVLGILLRRHRPSPEWLARGTMLAALGLALQLAEVLWLQRRWGVGMVQDYVCGTLLYGLGAAMMALSGSSSDSGAARLRPLAAIGPLVLGIYLSHYLFIDLLHPLGAILDRRPGGQAAYVALVFACALPFTMLLAHWPPTRRLVL